MLVVYYSLTTNSVRGVRQEKFVRQKFLKPTHLCTPFSLLHIALCQLSALGLGNIFHNTDRKIHYGALLQITCDSISLRGGCRTLPTYKM